MNDELKHYGVLGMKWGVRRGRSVSEDHTRASQLKRKSMEEMSNAELRELTNRMQLESSYRNLKRSNISRGRQIVNQVVGGTAIAVTSAYLNKQGSKGLNYLVEKGFKLGKAILKPRRIDM